jgi:hypothetical protein
MVHLDLSVHRIDLLSDMDRTIVKQKKSIGFFSDGFSISISINAVDSADRSKLRSLSST